MANVLVCLEDLEIKKLDSLLRRVVSGIGQGFSDEKLHFDSARGFGGFSPFVKKAWPIYRAHGCPNTRFHSFDYLICVADADRAEECCPGLAPPPPPPSGTQDWVNNADASWTTHLRQIAANISVSGMFLRWNKESVLLTAHDLEDLYSVVGVSRPPNLEGVNAYLQTCNPRPYEVSDKLFNDSYRRPLKCLQELFKAAQVGSLAKNDVAFDTILERLRENVPARTKCLARATDVRKVGAEIFAKVTASPTNGGA